MINCVLIDDDKQLRLGLKTLLQKYNPELTVIGEADSKQNGIEVLENLKPQVVFLDIQLLDGTGFDILESYLKRNGKLNFQVVFVTAHEQYALKAFKFSASDYILKPIDPDDLHVAINKIKLNINQTNNSENIDLLLENLKKNHDNFKRIALSTQESIHLFEINDIIRCESLDNYTKFYIKNSKPILISKTLKDYEDLLSDYGFERIHQSHLINLSYLKSYVKADGGYVIMWDNANIPVSQRKKDRLQEIIKRL